jgi:hypothetical protein
MNAYTIFNKSLGKLGRYPMFKVGYLVLFSLDLNFRIFFRQVNVNFRVFRGLA